MVFIDTFQQPNVVGSETNRSSFTRFQFFLGPYPLGPFEHEKACTSSYESLISTRRERRVTYMAAKEAYHMAIREAYHLRTAATIRSYHV